mmetsp:Transcript_3618/g.5614  ORF Transcript_3618/g.5614 Transcript_3618/m.5614 type:complete len:220 (-) Transcript_3618:195-854(-)
MQSVATTRSKVSPSAVAASWPQISSLTSHVIVPPPASAPALAPLPLPPPPQLVSKFSRNSWRFSPRSVATTRLAPTATSAALTSPHPAPSSHTRSPRNISGCFSTYLASTMALSHTSGERRDATHASAEVPSVSGPWGSTVRQFDSEVRSPGTGRLLTRIVQMAGSRGSQGAGPGVVTVPCRGREPPGGAVFEARLPQVEGTRVDGAVGAPHGHAVDIR